MAFNVDKFKRISSYEEMVDALYLKSPETCAEFSETWADILKKHKAE